MTMQSMISSKKDYKEEKKSKIQDNLRDTLKTYRCLVDQDGW